MEEKIEQAYQEYLKGKLDLVFLEPSEKKIDNLLIKKEEKKSTFDDIDEETLNSIKRRFDVVSNFHGGLALARLRYSRSFFIIDTDAHIVKTLPENIKRAYFISNNRILVEKDQWKQFLSDEFLIDKKLYYLRVEEYNVMDFEGNLLFKDWFSKINFLDDGYARVIKDDKYTFVDSDFNFVFDYVKAPYDLKDDDPTYKGLTNTHNFLIFNEKVKPKKIEMGDYVVKYSFGKYKCKYKKDSYTLKYMPLKRYGTRYTLCIDYVSNCVYLYDRTLNEYNEMGYASNTIYDDYIIYNTYNGKKTLIYEDNQYDITTYFNSYLKDKEGFCVNDGIKGILTKDEFKIDNMQMIDEMRREENFNNRRIEEELAKKQQEQDIINAQIKAEADEEIRKKTEKDLLAKLQIILESLKEVRSSDGKVPRIPFEYIFINVGKHREINPDMMDLLKYIDLSLLSFDNVKMTGIDFSECNLHFDPQKAHLRDLSNSIFCGVHIGPWMNFNGVNICGCKFSDDNDEKTLDQFNSFDGAIYDENTTYNGTPISELIKNKDNAK